jgi:hypothetical protein
MLSGDIVNPVSRLLSCIVLAFVLQSPAMAGAYSDDLGKCLVNSTSSADKSTLVQWMFAMMALHPDVRQLASVSTSQRTRLNQRMATLMESLLTNACVAQARDAVKYEGPSTIESSFNVLAQVAGRELFSNPGVSDGMAEFGKRVDGEKLKKALGVDQQFQE